MKHLLFTSAIALLSIFAFAQNGTYIDQRNGQRGQAASTAQQNSYSQNNGYNQNGNSQKSGGQITKNQQVVQQSTNAYA